MYSSILVAVDLGEEDSWAKSVPTALELSKCFGAKVSLVNVVSDALLAVEAEWSGLALRRILDTARARLALLAREYSADATMGVHVVTGSVYRGILDVADQQSADLIIVDAHKGALRDFLIGQNAERVVRHALCSVLVLRD